MQRAFDRFSAVNADQSVPVGQLPLIDPARADEMVRDLGVATTHRFMGLMLIDMMHRPAQIVELAKVWNVNSMRREAHALYGAALAIGASRLAAASRSMVAAQTHDEIPQLIGGFEEAVAATKKALETFRASLTD